MMVENVINNPKNKFMNVTGKPFEDFRNKCVIRIPFNHPLTVFSGGNDLEFVPECSEVCNITNPAWCENFLVGLT
jgi:hypothetical protein